MAKEKPITKRTVFHGKNGASIIAEPIESAEPQPKGTGRISIVTAARQLSALDSLLRRGIINKKRHAAEVAMAEGEARMKGVPWRKFEEPWIGHRLGFWLATTMSPYPEEKAHADLMYRAYVRNRRTRASAYKYGYTLMTSFAVNLNQREPR